MATLCVVAGAAIPGMLLAAPPTGCGAIGVNGVLAMSFPDPGGATVETPTATIGAWAGYANVTTVDGRLIDARATLTAISGGTIEFENSSSADANFLLTRTGASAMTAEVRWDFHDAGDPLQPVPILATWVIGDLDGNDRQSLSIPSDDVASMQALATGGVILDGASDPATATGNLEWDGWSGTPPEGSRVQLDFAGVDSFTITYRLGLGAPSARFAHTGNGDLALAGSTTCVGVSNHDGDAATDIADGDDDNDGIADAVEGDSDTDGDGLPDHRDLDADNDGIGDTTEGSADFDGDGTPNFQDFDADGDGIDDAVEAGHPVGATAGVIPGPYGQNGMDDSVETADSRDGSAVTENYVIGNVDGGTVDYLESADVELVSLSSPSVVPGDRAVVAFEVANNGNGHAGAVEVDYPLPAGTALDVGASPGCTTVSGSVRCTVDGPINAGASVSADFTLDTSPSATPATSATSASIAVTATPDPDGGNDGATATWQFLDRAADLRLVSVSSPTVTPGTSGPVIVGYENLGPSEAQDFEIAYPIPNGATFVPGSSTAGCGPDGAATTVVCPVSGPITPSVTGIVTLDFSTLPGAQPGTETLTARIQNQTTPDHDGGNDTRDGDFVVGNPVADIEVAATTPTVIPGEAGTVTITVTYEAGPSVAADSTAIHLLPPDVTVAAALPAGCTEGPTGTVTCDAGDLSAGSVGFVIPVLVSGSAPASTRLDGTVQATTAATDVDGASADADINTAPADADLVIAVSDPPPLAPGERGTVNLAVTNLGPSQAADPSVVYVAPTGASIDVDSMVAAGCVESPAGTATCGPYPPLAPGGTISIELGVTTPPGGPPSTSLADGRAGAVSATGDPTPGDNTDINSTILVGQPSANLGVAVGPIPPLRPAATTTIDATVTNHGPSNGGSSVIETTLPTGLLFDDGHANPDGCTAVGSIVSCPPVGPMSPDTSVTVTIPVRMALDQPDAGPNRTVAVAVTGQAVTDPSSVDDRADAVIALDLTGDSDGDGLTDGVELDPSMTGSVADADGDGTPDYLDLDADDDGIGDATEIDGGALRDTDGDGVADHLDLDSDDDGITDVAESGNGHLDQNLDGRLDATTAPLSAAPVGAGSFAAAGATPLNTDGTGPADHLDVDADDDGVLDVDEGGHGHLDADGDGRIDGVGSPSVDSNHDGLADAVVGTAAPDSDGVGEPDYRDLDADGDGIGDVVEGGNGALDGDGDGRVDGVAANDLNGDGVHDAIVAPADRDGDGLIDVLDVDSDGDGIEDSVEGDGDPDGDGTPSYLDLDADGDGIPDVVEAGHGPLDADGDGMIDDQAQRDGDGDGWADGLSGQPVDSDGDGIPDFGDLDADGDGIADRLEAGPNPNQPLDSDGDGLPDFQDLDADGDGRTDEAEAGDPAQPRDSDGDGVPDFRDVDSDGDGIEDADEQTGDSDGDGLDDIVDYDPVVISGTVVEQGSGRPVPNATVTIIDSVDASLVVTADDRGRYRFEARPGSSLAPGPVSLVVRAPGYDELVHQVIVVNGAVLAQDLRLRAQGDAVEPPTLAYSGSDTSGLALFGALLAAVGAAILFIAARAGPAGRT